MEYPLVKIPYKNHKSAPTLFTTLNRFPSKTNDARMKAVAIKPKYSTDSIIILLNTIHIPIRD